MRVIFEALRDLMRGLFGFPANRAAGGDTAAGVEARYRAPRRCC